MKCAPLLCTTFLILTLGLKYSQALNRSEEYEPETEEVKNFEQLYQLWRKDIYSASNTEDVQTLVNKPEDLRLSLTNLTRVVLAGVLQVDHMYRGTHRYYDDDLITRASGPLINHTLCLEQLETLVKRADTLLATGFNSTDVELFRLMDTFGRIQSGFTYLDTTWPGHYTECLNQKFRVGQDKTGFRYCLAGLKLKHWPQTRMTEYFTYEMGVCIPEACHSFRYRNNFELVEKLIKLNTWTPLANEIQLVNLYCLPDKSSAYSAWWLEGKTCLFVFLAVLWIMAQLLATIKLRHEPLERTHGNQVWKSLDVRRNLASLLAMNHVSNDTNQHAETSKSSTVINVEIARGLKVICLALVMMGHFLMITTANMRSSATFNSVELANYLFSISNEPPAFLISIFFLLTGVMISYQSFHARSAHSMACNPSRWFLLILKRYLRLAPVYVFMVAYSKYLAKYTSSGPFWDYGTSALSPRKLCEQESWWWTLTFSVNFKPMQATCVVPGWYVASDLQFIALSPIFLTGLARHPRVTKLLMYLTAVCSLVASGVTTYFNEIPDFTPVYRINLFSNGFSTAFMNEVYTRPQYRITGFLVGLLVGHYLYERSNSKQPHQSAAKPTSGGTLSWCMNLLRRHDKLFSALVFINLAFLLHIGIVAKEVPFHGKQVARIAVATLFPLLLSMASISMGLYLILASEGRGCKAINKLLSSSYWLPLSKMNHSILVCHCEVIIFIVHSITLPIYLEFFTHLSLIILTLLATYTVSALLYLLVEAPFGQLLKSVVLARL